MKTKAWSLAIILLISAPAFAGPPFLTNDTGLTDYQHIQVYLYSTTYTNPNETTVYAPAMEFDWGFMQNFDLELTSAFTSYFPDGGPNAAGFGDSTLSLGYRFIQETDDCPSVAFIPQLTIPTGNAERDIGNGKIITQLPLWLQKSFGNWTINTGGGYNFNPAPEMYNNAFAGFLLQNQITPKLMLGGELFYQGAQGEDYGNAALLNLGGIYNITPQLSLLFSAGNSIAGQETFVSYLGIQWVSKV